MTDNVHEEIENPAYKIWNDQPISDDPAEFLKWFEGLTKPQQVCFPTQWLCIEVYNGGFHQYFSNSTGLHAPEAVCGFRALGLNEIAEIVEKAMSVFGEEYPRDRETREEFLDSIEGIDISESNPFFELDEVFYKAMKIPGAPDRYDEDRFTIAAKDYVSRIT
jgi:hypothetical protein